MLDLIGNGRPAGDLLSRVVRFTLGGTTYDLPVLTIGGNKRWRAQLDARLTALLDGLNDGGNDIAAIFAVLSSQVDDLLELLIAYDTTHVLPERAALEDSAYEDELLAATREVWRAANPLVGMGIEALETTAASVSESSPPTSSPPPSTAGSRRRSRKN